MSSIVADRVLEISTSTGAGALTLGGAATGYRTAESVCANGDTFAGYVEAVDASGIATGDWETGTYTWGTGGTLTIVGSPDASSTGSKITWAAGSKRVSLGLTAASLALKSDATHNHTGVYDLAGSAAAAQAASTPVAHATDTANPHAVTKTQVGLSNVDNTSDVDKPVSTATGTALGLKAALTTNTFTGAQIGAVTALTSTAASIAIDLAVNNNFSHTTSENTTLAAPSNPVAGQSGFITITQGATPRLLAYNTFWDFAGGTIPTLTATIGARDILAYAVLPGAATAHCQLLKDSK